MGIPRLETEDLNDTRVHVAYVTFRLAIEVRDKISLCVTRLVS